MAGCAFVIELAFLGGRERLAPHDVHSLISYDVGIVPVPVVSRSRTVPAAPERLWTAVAGPRAPARVVARASSASRTPHARRGPPCSVTPKGRTLRADYTLLESDHPRRLRWRHEVEESPFERILASSVTELELEPAGGGRDRACG